MEVNIDAGVIGIFEAGFAYVKGGFEIHETIYDVGITADLP